MRQLIGLRSDDSDHHQHQHLRRGAQSNRVSARHPGAVALHVPAQDDRESNNDARDHRRTKHDARGVQQRTGAVGTGVENRHPQSGQTHQESASNQQPPGHAVPDRPAAAETGRELEWSQDGEYRRAHDVQDHGQRHGREPRVHRHRV